VRRNRDTEAPSVIIIDHNHVKRLTAVSYRMGMENGEECVMGYYMSVLLGKLMVSQIPVTVYCLHICFSLLCTAQILGQGETNS